MKNVNPTDAAYNYIMLTSKADLQNKLGITRPTLNSRLKSGNWTASEIKILLSLNKTNYGSNN